MNLFRKTLTLLGSILLAALLLAALAPRAARGVAAALVQVTNTTSTPVPTSDVSPLQPFEQNCETSTAIVCQIPVPAGKRLVVQTASIEVLTAPGVVVVLAGIQTTTPGAGAFSVPVVFTGTSNGNNFHTGTQSLRVYEDSSLTCITFLSDPALTNFALNCSVSGYLVDIP